jgi:iron complex transport system substrate-binding protein
LKTKLSYSIIILMLIIIFAITSIFSGCKSRSSGASQKTNPVSINDMTGRTVMIPEPQDIKRVAVLTSPQVLAAYAVGVQDKLCGVTNAVKKWDMLNMYDPHLKKVPAVRSQMAEVNIEALLQADPDIVIGSELDMDKVDKSTKLTTLRINSAQVNGSISQTKDEMRFFGLLFNRQEKSELYVSYLDNILSLIKFSLADIPAEKRLKVFMGYNADHLTTYGGETFMDDWIKAAGCINAAGAVSGLGGKEGGQVTVSMEQVLSWDPDIIIIDNGNPDDLLNNPSWSKLKACQNKKIYRLPVGLFIWNRASCEAAAMVPQWLAITAYPEKLAFMNINDRVREFYIKIFSIQLTDRLIHNILYPGQDQK